MTSFSLVTNVTVGESGRVIHVLPHWLRVFRDQIADLTIVFDRQGASGRIKRLHGEPGALAETEEALRNLKALDRRVNVVDLPDAPTLQSIGRRWFGNSTVPMRCQAGTPLLAFIHAMSLGKEDVVLRADCDMLFHEAGWLQEAIDRTIECDLVEPPRLGWDESRAAPSPSTRCLLMRPARVDQHLPIRPALLGPARSLHRRLGGRENWLSLERALSENVESGRLSYHYLESGGYTLHLSERRFCETTWVASVIAAVEAGDVPSPQHESNNFIPQAWGHV